MHKHTYLHEVCICICIHVHGQKIIFILTKEFLLLVVWCPCNCPRGQLHVSLVGLRKWRHFRSDPVIYTCKITNYCHNLKCDFDGRNPSPQIPSFPETTTPKCCVQGLTILPVGAETILQAMKMGLQTTHCFTASFPLLSCLFAMAIFFCGECIDLEKKESIIMRGVQSFVF